MRDVLSSLGRRWYLTAAGLVATAALGTAAVYLIPPTYEATGSVVLLPPASTVEAGGNPYLQLGGLNQVADILTRSMMAQSTSETVADSHPSAAYTVAPDPATSGPILVVTAEDHSADGASATLADVMALVPRQLADLQQSLGYTGNTQITSAVLAKDSQPETIRKAQIRAALAAVVVGLVLTGLLVALIDGLIERRVHARSSGESRTPTHHPRAPEESAAPPEPAEPSAASRTASHDGGDRRPTSPQAAAWGADSARAEDPTDSDEYSIARQR